MSSNFDFQRRMRKIRSFMEAEDINVLVATRLMSVCYVSGAFIPYRAAALIPLEGEVELFPSIIEAERVRAETWIERINAWGPIPGLYWTEQVANRIKELGLDKGVIGVEAEVTPRLIEGVINHAEFTMLKEKLPDATFVNASNVMNEAVVVKEPAEIERMRKAASIADEGMKAALRALKVGVTEAAVLGAGEKVMRELGSMWNWPVTGGDEIASGYRGGYSRCGCTPPSNKIIREGEIVMIDLHSTYELYYSDLSYNVVMGRANSEQKKMIETFIELSYLLLDNISPGVTVGEVARKVMDKLSKTEYAPHTPPVFGHGIGIVGHEWYPPITVFEPWTSYEFKEGMVEELYLQINKPGVEGLRLEIPVLVTKKGCERLTKTPIEPAEHQPE